MILWFLPVNSINTHQLFLIRTAYYWKTRLNAKQETAKQKAARSEME